MWSFFSLDGHDFEIGIANPLQAKDVPAPSQPQRRKPERRSTEATVLKCRKEDQEELFLTPQCDTQ